MRAIKSRAEETAVSATPAPTPYPTRAMTPAPITPARADKAGSWMWDNNRGTNPLAQPSPKAGSAPHR